MTQRTTEYECRSPIGGVVRVYGIIDGIMMDVKNCA
jgi:hypothetical protein